MVGLHDLRGLFSMTSWSSASFLPELQLLEMEAETSPEVTWSRRCISEPCGGSVGLRWACLPFPRLSLLLEILSFATPWIC